MHRYKTETLEQHYFSELLGHPALECVTGSFGWWVFKFSIWWLIAPQVGEKVRVRFFADSNDLEDSHQPFSRRVPNIQRSPYNSRQQDGVRAEYVKSVKLRGIVENVRGEAWLQQRPSEVITATSDGKVASYLALSFASLTEAFYCALQQEPQNKNLLLTLARGLECRIIHPRTPPSVCRYLVNLHNRFHTGSSTSFVELLTIVPDVSCIIWYIISVSPSPMPGVFVVDSQHRANLFHAYQMNHWITEQNDKFNSYIISNKKCINTLRIWKHIYLYM